PISFPSVVYSRKCCSTTWNHFGRIPASKADSFHAWITYTRSIGRSHEYHPPLVLVFADYKKAFDSVKVNAVPNALIQAGAPPAQLLEQCFRNYSVIFTAALQNPMSNLNWEDKGYINKKYEYPPPRGNVNELNVEGLKIGLEMSMSKTQMVNQWCDTGTIKLAGKALE
ncbi:hypothetical protein OSTOST_22188, partial [Ostertagia ostertagi]